MTEDRIERDTLIAAPLERVWSLVVQPGFWVGDEASRSGIVATPGEILVVNNPEHGAFPVRVEKVDPPTYLAYRWVSAFPGEELRDDNSTLVELRLTKEGEQTRLRVVESGFAALVTSDEVRQSTIKDHTAGWPQCLEALEKRAIESAA